MIIRYLDMHENPYSIHKTFTDKNRTFTKKCVKRFKQVPLLVSFAITLALTAHLNSNHSCVLCTLYLEKKNIYSFSSFYEINL